MPVCNATSLYNLLTIDGRTAADRHAVCCRRSECHPADPGRRRLWLSLSPPIHDAPCPHTQRLCFPGRALWASCSRPRRTQTGGTSAHDLPWKAFPSALTVCVRLAALKDDGAGRSGVEEGAHPGEGERLATPTHGGTRLPGPTTWHDWTSQGSTHYLYRRHAGRLAGRQTTLEAHARRWFARGCRAMSIRFQANKPVSVSSGTRGSPPSWCGGLPHAARTRGHTSPLHAEASAATSLATLGVPKPVAASQPGAAV